MGFHRQEYWSGLSFPSPGDFLNPGIKSTSPAVLVLAGGYFTTEPPGKPDKGERGEWKPGLKLNIKKKKAKILASGPTISWQINGEKWKQWQILFPWANVLILDLTGRIFCLDTNLVHSFIIKLLGSYNKKQELKWCWLKTRKGKDLENRTKEGQRKVWGPEWGLQVEQTALPASPICIGQTQGREKHIKIGAKGLFLSPTRWSAPPLFNVRRSKSLLWQDRTRKHTLA